MQHSARQGSGVIPSIQHQAPSAWPDNLAGSSGRVAPGVVPSSFYDDSSESQSQISPGFAPPNGLNFGLDPDHRRPSVASATTVSSSGSRTSAGPKSQKKLKGFFGENYIPSADESRSRHNSEASLVQDGGRYRKNSVNDPALRSGPPSPTSSRPRTPGVGPSNEVTPWEFQDVSGPTLSTLR